MITHPLLGSGKGDLQRPGLAESRSWVVRRSTTPGGPARPARERRMRWMGFMATSSWIGPAGRHLVRALDALPTCGRGTFGARHGCLPVVCRAGAAAGDLADHHDATSRVMAQFGS